MKSHIRIYVLLTTLAIALSIPDTTLAAIVSDLRYGSRGAEVVELQQLLIARGYLNAEVSGNFYGLTKKAVIAFQVAYGLPGTGFVGPLTRKKILDVAKTGTHTEILPTPASIPGTSTTNVFDLTKVPFYVTRNLWAFSSTTGFDTATTIRPPVADFRDSTTLAELPIDPRSIVLVRCRFTPSYVGNTAGGSLEPLITTGTGVVISSDGSILTAAHVLRVKELVEDDTARIWTRDSCQIAPTDQSLTPIDSGEEWGFTSASRFVPAEIVFEPTDLQYNPSTIRDPDNGGKLTKIGGGADLDFALLRAKGANLPAAPLIGKLLYMAPGEKMLGIGYPGLDIRAAQSLERIDTEFYGYTWQEDSSCAKKIIVDDCGIRYQSRRYKLEYKQLYGKQTPLGKHTPYFRGGFSGGPLFYKGYVAGIITTSRENQYSNLYDIATVGNWNWVEALATREIVSVLKEKGITIPTY